PQWALADALFEQHPVDAVQPPPGSLAAPVLAVLVLGPLPLGPGALRLSPGQCAPPCGRRGAVLLGRAGPPGRVLAGRPGPSGSGPLGLAPVGAPSPARRVRGLGHGAARRALGLLLSRGALGLPSPSTGGRRAAARALGGARAFRP